MFNMGCAQSAIKHISPLLNGVPVSYNLAILGAYIQRRHSTDYDDEVRRLLSRFTRNVSR